MLLVGQTDKRSPYATGTHIIEIMDKDAKRSDRLYAVIQIPQRYNTDPQTLRQAFLLNFLDTCRR